MNMRALRKFVADNPHIDDGCVLLVADANPTGDFDNSGFPVHEIAHDGIHDPNDAHDVGVVYLLAVGIEY